VQTGAEDHRRSPPSSSRSFGKRRRDRQATSTPAPAQLKRRRTTPGAADRADLADGLARRSPATGARGHRRREEAVHPEARTRRSSPRRCSRRPARKLRFTAQRTMRTAQRLYENGFITYMRTDSTTLSTEAIDAARKPGREPVRRRVPAGRAARLHQARSRARRRPTRRSAPPARSFRTPESLKGQLEEDQWKLYDLIWKRTVASQMKDATGERTRCAWRDPGRASIAGAPTGPARTRRAHRRRARCSRSRASCAPTSRAPTIPRPSSRIKRSSCRPWPRAIALRARWPRPRSTPPSRRSASPRPAWSRSSRIAASAGRRPTRRSSRPSRTAATCSRRAARWCRP
jgi:hypothetical protein